MKWMITASRDQNGPKDAKMFNKLAKEILDAYNNEVKKTLYHISRGLIFFLITHYHAKRHAKNIFVKGTIFCIYL